MLEIGSVIDGKYKILDEIGKGGMSVVYQAKNERANKHWAIKEIRKDGVQDYEVVRQNLIAETDMLKKLNHPNLPSIVDVIDRDGAFLIVMDYIEGKPLSKILEMGGAQPQEDVIEWAKQLCDVLGYLHSRKPAIIYRDMKPSNVMLKPDGNVMLIDFGTAREFKSTSVEDTKCLGTVGYAAPEQFGGHGQTDARTDIYCLGATMYHLVTGHNPAIYPYEMYPIRQWNPTLSSGLEEIILKCTQKNPNERYQNCAELLYALDHFELLDKEYKREQNLKWRIFCSSVIATIVMGIGAIGFSIGASVQVSNTYQGYINKAKSETVLEKRIDNCKNAIAIAPKKYEAYETLLKTYYEYDKDSFENADSVFSFKEEYTPFQTITSQYLNSNDSSYNTEEFADKIYLRVGEALFFMCDNDTQGKNSSMSWLEKAEKYCSKNNKPYAELLYSIAKYYKDSKEASSGVSATGFISDIDYIDYWLKLNDIEKYARNFMDSNDNILLMLDTCKLCISEINVNVARFKKGVSIEQMDEFIQRINNDISAMEQLLAERVKVKSDYYKKLHDLKNNLNKAKDAVKREYGNGS